MAVAKRPTRGVDRRIARLPARIALALRFARTPARRVVVLWLRDHFRFGPYLVAGLLRPGDAIEVVKGSAYAPDLAMLRRLGVGMVSTSAARLRPRGKILVTDDPEVATGALWGRRVVLSYDYYGALLGAGRGDDAAIMPYFMHPTVYETGLDRRLLALRASPKRIRVLFAGSVGATEYGEAFRWPMLNRHEVMSTLLETAGGAIEHVERGTDRDAFLASDHDLVVALTHAAGSSLAKHPLTQPEMLRFAASSHFFVCPPGIRMPHSHNLIEAMGVGAVPITNYAHLFDPPLEHGRTCLRFEAGDDLRDAVAQARSMSVEAIATLRANVVGYYDDHLAPSAFFARSLRGAGGMQTLHVLNERSPDALLVPPDATAPVGA